MRKPIRFWGSLGALVLAGCLSVTVFYAQTPDSEQTLWAPYWTVERGFTSTLAVKNNRADRSVTAHVSLYFPTGDEYYVGPVILDSRQTTVLNLNQIYESLPSSLRARVGQEGSVEVEFDAPNESAIMGGVSVTSPDQGIAWNFRLYGRHANLPIVPLKGVFWFYDSQSDGFVALQNTSHDAIVVTPRVHANGSVYPLAPIQLGAEQIYKLKLGKEIRKLGLSNVTVGAIELVYEGPPDALLAHGALYNGRGFSAEIDFLRRATATEDYFFSQRTPRFAIGPADPRLGLPGATSFEPLLALANLADNAMTVQLKVGFRANETDQEVELPVVLAGRESRVFNLSEQLQGVVPPETHWASLEVNYISQDAQLAAGLASVSADGAHSIGSVLNPREGAVADGWYWQVDPDATTLLGIINVDTEEATVEVWLDYYTDGQSRRYNLPQTVIPARASVLLDLSQFVSSSQPDADGEIIPPGVTFGGYRVRKIAGRPQHRLTVESLLVNRRTKTYLPFYNTCCGYLNISAHPDSITGPVGTSQQIDLVGQNSCSGWPELVNWAADFSTDNSNVASVNQSGTVSLNSPGTAGIHWLVVMDITTPGCDPYAEPPIGDGGPGPIICCGCSPHSEGGNVPVTVKPTVTISGPLNVPLRAAGSTGQNSIQLTATPNPAGGSLSWSSGSNKVTLANTTSASVTATSQAQSTSMGDVPITVNYTINGQSATATINITVAKSTSLQLISDTTNPNGQLCDPALKTIACGASGFPGNAPYTSYKKIRIYRVLDQFNRWIQGFQLQITEAYTPPSGPCSGPPVNIGSDTGDTITDCFYFCSETCRTGGACNISATQTLMANGFVVGTYNVNWTCTGATVQ